MALLGKALIHDVPDEYAIHKEKEFTFNNIRQPNRNRLLWSSNVNVDGMKTGTTAGAGYNPVASATQGDMRLIRWCWARKPTAFVLTSQKTADRVSASLKPSRRLSRTPLSSASASGLVIKVK